MKKFIIIAAAVIAVVLLVLWNGMSLKSDKVGLTDDGTYFGMNQFELFMKKGEDYEREELTAENATLYTYTESVFGKNALMSYKLVNNNNVISLVEVSAEISDAADIYATACDKLNEVYTAKKGFKNLGETTDENGKTTTLVTKEDNPQHNVIITLKNDNTLEITLKRNYEYSITERFFSFI